MPRGARILSLTPDHIARVHRIVEDTGPPAGVEQQTDADYAAWVERIVRTHPDRDRPTRLFAYGSLIWKPELDCTAEQVGMAKGWHRAFCLRQHRFRGTLTQPGLMMALDRGGTCTGVLYQLLEQHLEDQLDRLFRREFTVKPINSMPRWIKVQTERGSVTALSFVMNRASPYYAGRLSTAEIARTLAVACGHWGSGAEYLLNTVANLEARGIRDNGLWRLQQMVAELIDGLP